MALRIKQNVVALLLAYHNIIIIIIIMADTMRTRPKQGRFTRKEAIEEKIQLEELIRLGKV
jgi:hypothetical protein